MQAATAYETLGNVESAHIIRFEYCSQCGFKKFVTGAIAKIEKQWPDLFQYNLYQDKKVTGRLEATLFINSKDDTGDDGLLLHSRERTKMFIHDDYEAFLNYIESALAKC